MILKIKRYNSKEQLKVGDFVRILPEYLPGTTSRNYRNEFTIPMIRQYGGKIVKITNAIGSSPLLHLLPLSSSPLLPFSFSSSDTVPDDGFNYEIDHEPFYVWSSSMFSKTII